MGIIKVITHADAGNDYLINCCNYVTGGHTKYCGAVNVRSDDALNQFMAVRRYFGKVSGNQVVHFVVVLDTRFRNLDAAVKAGYRIADFFRNEYQLLFGVHEQTMENRRGKPRSYYHIHIVINPVSFVNGKMYANDWTDVTQFIKNLRIGDAMLLYGPTGCGKSQMLGDFIKVKPPDETVVIIVPRRCIKRQLRREVARKLGIPPDKAEEFLEWKNVYILTYQSFINRQKQFKGKLLTVFLDECHCLSSDATFAMYPQQMLQWLENNLDTTKRIYITATIDNVLPLIWSKEYIEYDAPPTSNNILNAHPEEIALFDFTKYTRIQQLVLMKANWDYLNFKFYDPSDPQKLAEYINAISKSGKKTLMLLNDIDKGRNFNQLLDPPARQIYSDSVDDALNEEISKITENSMFEGSVLITTKVANIGLSLHDSAIEVIVAESFGPEEIIQIIGRVRVDRRKPRPVTVLLPDYSSGDLGRMEHMLIEQLKDFKAAKENPYKYDREPYTYSSPEGRILVANDLAIKALDMKLKFIQKLKAEEQEHPHSFINHIFPFYGKGCYDDTLRIDYDAIIACKSLIQEAAKVFNKSDGSAAALDKLRDGLREAFVKTGIDFKRGNSKKPFDLSTNFQISTINDILEYGDVGWSLSQGYIKCDKEPIE